MTDELTDDDRRVTLIRMGMQVINALLHEQTGKQYNLILVACPAGEKTVSVVTRVESSTAMDGMVSVALSTLHSSAANDGMMQ